MPTELDQSSREHVQRLIRRETECLNRCDLDSWINLFTDDGYYWMPLEEEQTGPDQHDSLIYDNRALMEIRRNNLGHPLSPSMQHTRVRSVRILSDLEITVGSSTDDVEVTAWVMAAIYHRRQYHYAGRVKYTVAREGNEFRIRCKRVDLINADAPLDAIMMYV